MDFGFLIGSDWRMDYNLLISRNSELGINDNTDLGRNLGPFADPRNVVDSFISLPGFFKLQSLGILLNLLSLLIIFCHYFIVFSNVIFVVVVLFLFLVPCNVVFILSL